MALIDVKCPHCGAKGKIHDSYIGKSVPCTGCHAAFAVSRLQEAKKPSVPASRPQQIAGEEYRRLLAVCAFGLVVVYFTPLGGYRPVAMLWGKARGEICSQRGCREPAVRTVQYGYEGSSSASTSLHLCSRHADSAPGKIHQSEGSSSFYGVVVLSVILLVSGCIAAIRRLASDEDWETESKRQKALSGCLGSLVAMLLSSLLPWLAAIRN